MKILSSASAKLQENGIYNGDIKPENIIIVEDESEEDKFTYKIADYGIGGKTETPMISKTRLKGFSEFYASKEVNKIWNHKFEKNEYNPFKSDVYSLGITILEIVLGTMKNRKKMKNSWEQVTNQNLRNILKAMLKERIDFIELKRRLDNYEINIPENQDERVFVNKYRDQNTEKRLDPNTKPKIKFNDVAKEHLIIFKKYYEKLSRVNDSQYYIEKAYALMKENLIYSITKVEGLPVNFLPIKIKIFELYIEILEHLAVFYSDKGIIAKSDKLYLELQNMMKAFSKNFSENFQLLGENSTLLRQKGDFRGAEREDMEIHKKIEVLFGDENEMMERHLNNMGVDFYNMENFKKAKECYIKSMEIKKRIITEFESLEIATASTNVGTVYEKMNKLDKAEKLFLDALKIRIKKCGEIHYDVAFSYQNLGSVNMLKRNFEESEKYFNKALEIRKKLYRENHVNTAHSYGCLGMMHSQKGDFEKASYFLMKSYDLFKKTEDGENNSNFILLLKNFCELYEKTKNFKKYEEFADLYIEKASLFYGNGPTYENILNVIAANFLNQGLTQQWFKYFSKYR